MDLVSTKGHQAHDYQANVFTQLALAFMNGSPHYHQEGLYGEKAQESWMPGFQGVSFPAVNMK